MEDVVVVAVMTVKIIVIAGADDVVAAPEQFVAALEGLLVPAALRYFSDAVD